MIFRKIKNKVYMFLHRKKKDKTKEKETTGNRTHSF